MAEPFAIHALKAGGGVLGICPLPRRADLAEVVSWRPDMVLSMTETAEMEALGAGPLGAALSAAGIAWHHLPIRDFGAPSDAVQAAWPEVSTQARRFLAQGGRVLAHCRGGCGRSGMVLLRLMVELREAPEAALARLRAVRPCAVETEAQRLWAGQAGL